MNNKPWLFVLLGCGGVAVLGFLGCAGVIVYTALNFKSFDKDVSPVVDKLFAAAASGDFGSTYEADTSPEFKQVTSQEKYEEIGALVETRLGAMKSKSLAKYFISQKNADRFVDVTYNATFEKGTGTIAARFKKEGDRWVLQQININSPVLLGEVAKEKCPHCGKPIAASVKFCPHCGKAVAKDAEPATGVAETKPEESK